MAIKIRGDLVISSCEKTLDELNTQINNNTTKLNRYTPGEKSGSEFYDASRYSQLGYIKCELVEYTSYTNITLLLSSNFYGIQHFSTHLLNLVQAKNVKAYYIKIGEGGEAPRKFYYKVDETNKRIYIYAYITGGNGSGVWNVTVLNDMYGTWVNERINNVTKEDSWVEINSSIPDRVYQTPSNIGDYIVLKKLASEEPIKWKAEGSWTLHGLSQVDRVSGSSFTKTSENATVKVGKNVKKVRVDAACQFQIGTSKTMYVMLAIYKNNTQVAMSIRSNSAWDTLHCTTCLDVVEGDLISCKLYKGEADEVQIYDLLASFGPGRGNHLTVECIG